MRFWKRYKEGRLQSITSSFLLDDKPTILQQSGKNSQQSKAKRCKTDESCRTRSPMNDLFNIGEIMRATEESIRTALESANLNFQDSKDSKYSKDSEDSKY